KKGVLTYRCNDDCPHCYVGRERNFPEMSTDEWKRVIDKCWEQGIPHATFTGGEATMRPDLPELIGYAEQVGLVTGLLTNGRKLADSLPNLLNNKLNVIVYNFVDMLSHARTEMEIIRELADDEPAYRSITQSWFEHSPLLDILQYLSEKKVDLIITSDHGSVRVQNPVKIVGDRNTSTNLRYKSGRTLSYNSREVFEVRNPEDAYLPKTNVSSVYVFSRRNDFFAYPNNYNYYANYYKNTFQHGGISIEEMLVPFITLSPK
ncbi:MAG TPA: radical SAM protein, partial [Bacteroidales bacterium]|nr:radical SAM protein [Bacteroidales bacterium]